MRRQYRVAKYNETPACFALPFFLFFFLRSAFCARKSQHHLRAESNYSARASAHVSRPPKRSVKPVVQAAMPALQSDAKLTVSPARPAGLQKALRLILLQPALPVPDRSARQA